MELQITDETFKKHLDEAILASLGPEMQKEIIKQAIADLTVKQIFKRNQYDTSGEERPSKMQEIFGRAVENHAREVVTRLVQEDGDVKLAVEGFVKQAMLQLLKDGDNKLSIAMAEAMGKALSGDRY